MTAATRAAVDQRRANVLPRRLTSLDPSPRFQCIGMHIRGGDACFASRFCPANLTASFFGTAARLRERYGLRRIVLATDSAPAAALCASGVLGFECHTLQMVRSKFESATFIEKRVARHEEGQLSGSAVALDALADIDMLADCDAFVLVLRSAISRLVYALALARKGRPLPVISLQNPTSPGFLKQRRKAQYLKASKVMPGRLKSKFY